MLKKTCIRKKRKGMILLVVVAFLAMFMVMGTTYILLADAYRKTSEQDLAGTDKRTAFAQMPDVDKRYLLNHFLGQLIYDCEDFFYNKIDEDNKNQPGPYQKYISNTDYRPNPYYGYIQNPPSLAAPVHPDLFSALRGHSFARNMYGGVSLRQVDNLHWVRVSEKPYSGTGRLSSNSLTLTHQNGATDVISEPNFLNYTFFNSLGILSQLSPVDPEKNQHSLAQSKISSFGVSYSSSDFNSPFLGKYSWNVTKIQTTAVSNELSWDVTNQSKLLGPGDNIYIPYPRSLGIPPLTTNVVSINPVPPGSDLNKLLVTLGGPINGLISPGTELLVFKLDFVPSFYRNGFGATNLASIPAALNAYAGNPNWFNTAGKYMLMRPRPYDNLVPADAASVALMPFQSQADLVNLRIQENKLFPYPEADGLDVKNLEGYPGGNDSIWMDVGFPVMKTADGRKYKALIAPLILDLDGRVNLNVAGNLMQRNNDPRPYDPDPMKFDPNYHYYNASHASNQGWGRWEVNPNKLLQRYTGDANFLPNEELYSYLSYKTLNNIAANTTKIPSPEVKYPGRFFNGNYTTVTNLGNSFPNNTNFYNNIPHSYAQVDFNGAGDFGPVLLGMQPNSNRWGPSQKPSLSNNQNGFPDFGSNKGFGNGKGIEFLLDGFDPNLNFHSLNFNSFRSSQMLSGRAFVYPASETANFLRWQGIGAPFENSRLALLMPKILGADLPYELTSTEGMFKFFIRNSLNTISADLDRPGLESVLADSPSPYAFTLKIGDFGFPERVTKAPPANSMTAGVPNVYKPIADQPTAPNQTSPALKINLNRNLTQFPALVTAPTSMMPSDQDRVNYVDWTNKSAQFKSAIQDRTNLAKEIYETLRNVTGVIKLEDAQAALSSMTVPNADKTSITTDLLEIKKSNRWLAQLAANIVDYIDSDDYNTAFQWTNDTQDWVFGVEMPRVVINEVYTMAQNDSNDTFNNDKMATMDTHFHTLIELLNPLPNDSSYNVAPGGHTAVLQCKDANGNTIKNYRLALCSPNQVAGRLNDVFNGQYFNNTGAFNFNNNNIVLDSNKDDPSDPNLVKKKLPAILDDWTDANFMVPNPPSVPPTWLLAPNNGNSTMVVADDTTLRMEANPQINPTMKSSRLKLKNLDKAMNPTDNHAPEVILQKLVYPGLPENDYDPMNPGALVNTGLPYNPYITVDVFSKHKMWDLRKYDSNAAKNPDVTTTNSYGRKAPFLDSAGLDLNNFNANWYNGNNSVTQKLPPPPPPIPPPSGPYHTMGNGVNNNASSPLPWLVHLDRQLINPMELLHVSTVKPHELTQTANRWADVFTQNNPMPVINPMTGQPDYPAKTSYPYVSNWPWYDENTRLHRFLEAVTVSPLQSGEAQNGRVLGKVNVNTMHSEEVFQAVADAGPANNFTQADVTNAYNNMKGQRPIMGFGQPNNADFSGPASKTGMNKSLLGYKAFDATNAGNVEIPNGNMLDVQGFANAGANAAPYPRKELLTKITNSITTRSNVFAVWITTGYFEVTDDSTSPPKLGAEIGKLDNINIRHRMFAIVDRTHLISGKLDNINLIVNTAPFKNFDFGLPNSVKLLNPASGTYAGLLDGMILTIDPNSDYEETVVLKLYNNPSNMSDPLNGHLVADFEKLHNPNGTGKVALIIRGNPGPWKGYDYKNDTQVVPYVEFIE